MLTSQDLEVLKKPFPDDVIGVKVQSFSKDRTKAMLVLYAQHTDVMNRIEEVDPSWHFAILDEKKVGDLVVTRAHLGIKGSTRENVGEGSDSKSAASDALKRCAMLYGIGRYLYDSELVWVPYDENRDRFKVWTMEEYRSLSKRSREGAPPIPSYKPENAPTPVFGNQPEQGDGESPIGYRIGFGKYRGYTLEEVPIKDHISYIQYLEENAEKTKKPISGPASEYLKRAEEFIANIENQVFPS